MAYTQTHNSMAIIIAIILSMRVFTNQTSSKYKQNFYTDGWQFGWVGGGEGCTTCVLKDVDNLKGLEFLMVHS